VHAVREGVDAVLLHARVINTDLRVCAHPRVSGGDTAALAMPGRSLHWWQLPQHAASSTAAAKSWCCLSPRANAVKPLTRGLTRNAAAEA
jgi:hypothetical protein